MGTGGISASPLLNSLTLHYFTILTCELPVQDRTVVRKAYKNVRVGRAGDDCCNAVLVSSHVHALAGRSENPVLTAFPNRPTPSIRQGFPAL
jgi:hypothetical protein